MSYTYDSAGRRTSMTDGTGTTQYTYYPTGEMSSLTYPDQTALQFDYEKRGLRTKQTVSRPGFHTSAQTEYNSLVRTPREVQVNDGQGTKLAGFLQLGLKC
ncbi:RHS repeat domain-containing protein [Paenibacillus thiaminolyticus]